MKTMRRVYIALKGSGNKVETDRTANEISTQLEPLLVEKILIRFQTINLDSMEKIEESFLNKKELLYLSGNKLPIVYFYVIYSSDNLKRVQAELDRIGEVAELRMLEADGHHNMSL